MSKRMLVNAAQEGEVRVAIVEDQVLEDLSIAVDGTEMQRGNIYKGVVVTVETGLQAAFVDFGEERNGFITFNDIHPRYYNIKQTKKTGRPKIQDALKPGAELLVQVHKEAVGNKGAALTTDITMPGRYLVFTPLSSTTGVSRKIEDEKSRKRLKDVVSSFDIPEDGGVIVRTAGQHEEPKALADDFQRLLRLWGHIRAGFETNERTKIVHREPDVIIRTIRDYLKLDVEELIVDDSSVFDRLTEYFGNDAPDIVERLKLYRGKMPIFSNYGLERQLAHISSHNVPLPSGGSIVINPTEALTAIDVNSGKSRGQANQEIMAYQTNLEAATAVARQLRLRDVGGLVVVDFIDMMEAKHRRGVTKQLNEAMTKDKARIEIGRISKFGLLELSRQRIKARLMMSSHLVCPHCEGSGYIMTTDFQAMTMLRRLQELAVSAPRKAKIIGRLPASIALRLLNGHRSSLAELEEKFEVQILLIPDADAAGTRDAFEITAGGGDESNSSDTHKRERKSRERRSRRSSNRSSSKQTDTSESTSEEETKAAQSTASSNNSKGRSNQSNKNEGNHRRQEREDSKTQAKEPRQDQSAQPQDNGQDEDAASARRAAARARIKARRAERAGQAQSGESTEQPQETSKSERPRRSRRPRRNTQSNRDGASNRNDVPRNSETNAPKHPEQSKSDALKAATRLAAKKLRTAQSKRSQPTEQNTAPTEAKSAPTESVQKPSKSTQTRKPVSLKNRLKSKLAQTPKEDSTKQSASPKKVEAKSSATKKKTASKPRSTAELLKAKLKAKTSVQSKSSPKKATETAKPKKPAAAKASAKTAAAKTGAKKSTATTRTAKATAKPVAKSATTATKPQAGAKTTRTRKAPAKTAKPAQDGQAKPETKKPATRRPRATAKAAADKPVRATKTAKAVEKAEPKVKATRTRSTTPKRAASTAAESATPAKATAKAKAPAKAAAPKKAPAKTAKAKTPAAKTATKTAAKPAASKKPAAKTATKTAAAKKPASPKATSKAKPAAKKPATPRTKKASAATDSAAKPKTTRTRTPRKTADSTPKANS